MLTYAGYVAFDDELTVSFSPHPVGVAMSVKLTEVALPARRCRVACV